MSYGGLRWTLPNVPAAAIRARRWRWLPWPTSCSPGCCATTRAGPTGLTATGSSFPTGTPRSCCTPCCSSTATGSSSSDIEQFRQWGSRTPGHPEVHSSPGVEVTTGPLGQGFANGVGMAVAERFLRSHFGPSLIDHHIFVFCGDGDLMEGVSHEAGLAGRPSRAGPSRLCVRRQPHHHRRLDGPRVLRRRPRALRGLRLARRAPGRGGERSRRSRGGPAPWHGRGGPPVAAGRSAATSAGPRRTEPTPRRPTATPSAPKRSASPRRCSACRRTTTSSSPTRCPRSTGESALRGQKAREDWEKRLAESAEDLDRFEACLQGRGLPGWADGLPSFESGTKLATRRAINKCLDRDGGRTSPASSRARAT